MALQLAPMTFGEIVISVTGNCRSQGALSYFFTFSTGWSQTESYYNVNIAISADPSQSDGSQVVAYLTRGIGPNTTVADEVAHASFVIPPQSAVGTSITIFQGLTLGPGSYYLTLFAPTHGVSVDNPRYAGGWCVPSFLNGTLTTGPGVTKLNDYILGTPSYPPSGGFAEQWSTPQFSVTGTPGTPPPPSGTIIVTSNRSEATFTLTPAIAGSPTGGPYPVTVPNAPAGKYQIAFQDIGGFVTPQLAAQTLPAGATVTFDGKYLTAPGSPNLLFDAGQVAVSPTLYGPQIPNSTTDSSGTQHTYNVFATQASGPPSSFDAATFSLSLAAEGTGSAMTLVVASGGDASCHCPTNGPDKAAGGAIQFLIPFGITVNKIDGPVNATFGDSSNPIDQAFQCAAGVLLNYGLGQAFGKWWTGFKLLECSNLLTIQAAGDACSITYPIITRAVGSCLGDAHNNSLFGEKALNTHQIRNVVWKPSIDGFPRSAVRFHFDEPPGDVLTTIAKKGMTVYVTTPAGDFWLDNFH